MGSCGCSGGMKDGRACTCNNCMKKRGYQKRMNPRGSADRADRWNDDERWVVVNTNTGKAMRRFKSKKKAQKYKSDLRMPKAHTIVGPTNASDASLRQNIYNHNPRLPKDGSVDGVLSRNPDPPNMNTGRGLPRGAPLGYNSMEEYYAAQNRGSAKFILNPVTGNTIQNTSRNRRSIAEQLRRAEIRMRLRRRQSATIAAQQKRYNHLMWWVPGNVGIVDAKGTIGVDDRVE
jgi:hypothetical protein